MEDMSATPETDAKEILCDCGMNYVPYDLARKLERQRDALADCLCRFIEADDIVNYDSHLCWGCGSLKTSKHAAHCLLADSQAALSSL